MNLSGPWPLSVDKPTGSALVSKPLSFFLIVVFQFRSHANSSLLLYEPWTGGLGSAEWQEGSLLIISI